MRKILIRYWEKESLDTLVPNENYGRDLVWEPVAQNSKKSKPPVFSDLARLHRIARNRKVLNVLEFGPGQSSLIIADALKKTSFNLADTQKTSGKEILFFFTRSGTARDGYAEPYQKCPNLYGNIVNFFLVQRVCLR